MCVCLSVCLSVCFLSATRHLSTLRRCLRVLREQPSRRGRPRARGGKHAQREHARACRTTSQRKNRCLSKTKPYARACCRICNCRDFRKKGKRKPICHFPSSVYSLPSLGVLTFRIVLNRILHKSSLLAPMESRRTRRPTFTAEERLERRREQNRRRHPRRNLTTEARRTFYLSVCQATLDFASNAYVHCLSNQLYNRLVITSHLCMKKVFGLDRSTPTQLILSKFNLYSFEQRVNL